MSQKIAIQPAGAAPALGPYSHAIKLGDLLFCSGQVPIDPAVPGGAVPSGIRDQTRRVLENVRLILSSQGLDFRHVVKTTVFMTNLAEFQGMNEVYAEFFPTPFPARSTVQVVALPRGSAVEIEVVASYSA
ncbi:MAG TPA: Rid family detoxifying hydrolase [Candidatus Limnocylindria bacterium]|jgi:2-iminobutanoate/2-iminopropanoate deaminase|nr:Rid family detoxifying hydrolase [Candidatus Limnocylindria bacterium]